MDRTKLPTFAAALLAGLVWWNDGSGAEFTVGGDPGCDFTLLQDAINAAQADTDPNALIRVARSKTYTAVAVAIDSHDMTIAGGFDDCDDSFPSGRTQLSGAGGTPDTIIRIGAASGGPFSVQLRDLNISGGDPAAGNFGGALEITGSNSVAVHNVVISGNSAQRGGGIYVDGGAVGKTSLTVSNGSMLFGNSATEAGGAIYCVNMIDEDEDVAVQADVFSNSAVNGGALFLDQCMLRYSAAFTGDGLFLNDAAESGGAAYLKGGSRMEFTGSTSVLAVLSLNTALLDGGAVYQTGDSDFVAITTQIVDNMAGRNGGALFQDSGDAIIIGDERGVGCGLDRCSRIESNRADGQGGAIYQTGGGVLVRRTWIMDNSSPDGAVIKSEGGSADFDSVIVARNRDATTIMRLKNGDYTITRSTFADNEDMADTILFTSATAFLRGTIFWESQGDAFDFFGGATAWSADCMLARSLPGATTGPTIFDDPLFVDPNNDDYHLSPASPAIDVCADLLTPLGINLLPEHKDIDYQERGIDFAGRQDVSGPYDIGADEYYDVIFANSFENLLLPMMP